MTVFLGLCDCNDVNWSGDLCNDCSETFYGPTCEPWMMALYMVPNQALDTGTVIAQAIGGTCISFIRLRMSSSLLCYFQFRWHDNSRVGSQLP